MVKKRVKLSSQAIEKFFQETNSQEGDEKTKTTPGKNDISSNAKESKSFTVVIPEEFIEKINALKEIVRQFKDVVKPEEFKKMTCNDLSKMSEK